MSMRYRQVIEVSADPYGTFPMDMLRYDGCYPEGSEDASKIGENLQLLDTARGPEDYPEKWVIRLVRFVETKKCEPTVGRWRSFGWDCEVVKTEKW